MPIKKLYKFFPIKCIILSSFTTVTTRDIVDIYMAKPDHQVRMGFDITAHCTVVGFELWRLWIALSPLEYVFGKNKSASIQEVWFDVNNARWHCFWCFITKHEVNVHKTVQMRTRATRKIVTKQPLKSGFDNKGRVKGYRIGWTIPLNVIIKVDHKTKNQADVFTSVKRAKNKQKKHIKPCHKPLTGPETAVSSLITHTQISDRSGN